MGMRTSPQCADWRHSKMLLVLAGVLPALATGDIIDHAKCRRERCMSRECTDMCEDRGCATVCRMKGCNSGVCDDPGGDTYDYCEYEKCNDLCNDGGCSMLCGISACHSSLCEGFCTGTNCDPFCHPFCKDQCEQEGCVWIEAAGTKSCWDPVTAMAFQQERLKGPGKIRQISMAKLSQSARLRLVLIGLFL